MNRVPYKLEELEKRYTKLDGRCMTDPKILIKDCFLQFYNQNPNIEKWKTTFYHFVKSKLCPQIEGHFPYFDEYIRSVEFRGFTESLTEHPLISLPSCHDN